MTFLHRIHRQVRIFVHPIRLRCFDQQMATKIGRDYMSNIRMEFYHQTIPTHLQCLEVKKKQENYVFIIDKYYLRVK